MNMNSNDGQNTITFAIIIIILVKNLNKRGQSRLISWTVRYKKKEFFFFESKDEY